MILLKMKWLMVLNYTHRWGFWVCFSFSFAGDWTFLVCDIMWLVTSYANGGLEGFKETVTHAQRADWAAASRMSWWVRAKWRVLLATGHEIPIKSWPNFTTDRCDYTIDLRLKKINAFCFSLAVRMIKVRAQNGTHTGVSESYSVNTGGCNHGWSLSDPSY